MFSEVKMADLLYIVLCMYTQIYCRLTHYSTMCRPLFMYIDFDNLGHQMSQ